MTTLFRFALMVLFPAVMSCQITAKKSAEEQIATIVEKTGAEILPKTVDIIKEGNADTQVTGIVTCMFATMEVLKKAVEMNCNLIITHEPLYYNHLDRNEAFETDEVYLAKKKFILDNELVVWRFHDYIHRIKPDGIISGMVKKLGWQDYQSKQSEYFFSFPKMTLEKFLKGIKITFPENAFHVVGNLEMELSNVVLAPGASGSLVHISQLRKKDIDLVVAGEVPQWETYEYVRDALAQGKDKAIVFIGHINSEESGMKFCADWLQEFITDIPVHFVECGSSYFTY